MESKSIIDSFLLSNPFHRGMGEILILVGMGICGLLFSWTKFSIFPVSNIFGGLLILSAFMFHGRTENEHKQAHERSESIDMIVTSGVYAKIRHPLYISIICMDIGIAIAFGVMATFILALLAIIHWVLTALKEEEALLKQFPDEYARYKQQVRWRMIPGIF
ncbi:MAG: isoprenylcysteine carboxylmethyltransferase family protein [Deltaproteobacteria bacterium]|nr:isoprenylcysteine carboxylmethyltransferase family protein [Deltaproteobacteria bacterium]